jgi:SAM-dependent methyltransferase
MLVMRPDVSKTYVRSAPTPQAAVDIFRGEWWSRLPAPLDTIRAGTAALFEDPRIQWAAEQLGGLRGKTVLDLGPLEGAHPYMFEQAGAVEVVGIEGNPRAFLKCLITKELLNLRRVSYRCGDFMEYLRRADRRFDIVNASGVLYHQRNPAELLALVCRTADALILWTHYYDAAVIKNLRRTNARFPGFTEEEYDGFRYRAYRHEYLHNVKMPGFCGAGASHSQWMEREAILECLRRFGMANLRIAFEDRVHENGPSFNLVASRG